MSRPSTHVDPSRSLWHLLGAHLRHWREDVHGLSLREVGKRALCDDGDLSKWERGLARPQADTIRRIDDVYDAGGQLAALHSAVTDLDRLRTLTRNDSEEERATERRRLFQLAAASIGIGALGSADEPVRQLLDLAMHTQHRSVEEWQLACADHLHAINTRPAHQVHDDLLHDLLALQEQVRAADPSDQIELQRVVAMLSAFHASVLTRLWQPGAALRWYRTARAAADAADHPDLCLIIRAHEAEHSLYGLRDPATVLALTTSALQIAGADPRPSPGIASVLRARAHALALLGRHEQAQQTLQEFLDVADKDLPAIPGFWEPADHRVYFTCSQVYSAAGAEAKASHVQEQVLKGNPAGYHVGVNIRLHAAHAMVVQGGVDAGLGYAASTLDSVPPQYRNVLVIETARRVLHAVPIGQRERPAAGELRELLAIAPTSDA